VSLFEAKCLVENLPQVAAFVSGSNQREAERCKAEFEELGATVTMELEFPTVTGPGYYEE
jgi:ribosomal protein L7/L12